MNRPHKELLVEKPGSTGAIQIVVRYHEIALKKKNRSRFVGQLARNLRRMLEGLPVRALRHDGRLIVELDAGAPRDEIRARVARICGIANFLIGQRAPREIDDLTAAVLDELAGRALGSFAVRSKRGDKTYPLPSPEIGRRIGRAVQERYGGRVDLEHPDLEIHVEIIPRSAYVALEKVAGPGGLPIGSSGRVVSLLSGGIDSPVATHRMLLRGCHVEAIHFHAVPYQSRASIEKVQEIAEVLNRWQPDLRIHHVPLGEVQREIVRVAPRPLRVVLYRRMMVRIAAELARERSALALATGESLGQVASQTLRNLATIEEASPIPILRPLIGMDKGEITGLARRLGTYEISVQPDEDCCQLFVPRHPSTTARVEEAREAEAAFDVPGLCRLAMEGRQVVEHRFPRRR